MDLWRIVWFIVAVILVAFLLCACQTVVPEVPPDPKLIEDPCYQVPGYESSQWANGHAWNSPEMSCL